MSFWNTQDGMVPKDEKEASVGGGDFAPLPNGTKVRAMIEEISWEEQKFDGVSTGYFYINTKWEVLEPEEYKGRRIFQKIHVLDGEEKKADRHKRILGAMDANSGGSLRQKDEMPSDESLMTALSGKIMVLRLGVWRDNDTKEIKGNFVQAVSPVNTELLTEEYSNNAIKNPAPINTPHGPKTAKAAEKNIEPTNPRSTKVPF